MSKHTILEMLQCQDAERMTYSWVAAGRRRVDVASFGSVRGGQTSATALLTLPQLMG